MSIIAKKNRIKITLEADPNRRRCQYNRRDVWINDYDIFGEIFKVKKYGWFFQFSEFGHDVIFAGKNFSEVRKTLTKEFKKFKTHICCVEKCEEDSPTG